MCLVRHLKTGDMLHIIDKDKDFITFRKVDSKIEGMRHISCMDQFELIECGGKCKEPCVLKARELERKKYK